MLHFKYCISLKNSESRPIHVKEIKNMYFELIRFFLQLKTILSIITIINLITYILL